MTVRRMGIDKSSRGVLVASVNQWANFALELLPVQDSLRECPKVRGFRAGR